LTRNLRVYELGRHYGVDSKQIMTLMKKMKVTVKSHMSVVEDTEVDRVHTVFQRKRELARENYAKAHGLNPDQLKNVAALKPLERPQPPEEPAPKKKAGKKKAGKKKKPAKPKVVVIKKSGTMTAVAKKAKEARAAEQKAEAAEEERRQEEQEAKAAKLAAKREEHAKARIVKNTAAKLVKKADIQPKEEAVVATDEDAISAKLEAQPDTAPDGVTTETIADAAEVETPTAADGKAPVADGPAESTSEPESESAPVMEPEDPLAKLGSKKQDGFKVGDIIRAAPKVKPERGFSADKRRRRSIRLRSTRLSNKPWLRWAVPPAPRRSVAKAVRRMKSSKWKPRCLNSPNSSPCRSWPRSWASRPRN